MEFPPPGDKDELERGERFTPRFDAHGLVSAIVVDDATGEVLMVAHMNADAVAATLETGLAHYWSRSRAKLWRKGEDSGNTQEVVAVLVDCDQDALVVRVNQKGAGAACHTGQRSCFYRRVVMVDGSPALTATGDAALFDPAVVYSPKT